MAGDPVRRGAAEFVGTFALTFIGAGSIMVGADLVGVAFAHGLVIAVMASAVGHISGGHFNPAVTFGFLITKRITGSLAVVYWIAQMLGAVLGALLLLWIFPERITDATNLGAPTVSEEISVGAGFLVELILTFLLVWVIFASAADPRGSFASIAGLAIGLTITLDILMGGPLTGAAMNPSRAFGPELVAWFWADAWIWYIAPLLGGGLAALAYEHLYLRGLEVPPAGTVESEIAEPAVGEEAT
ncbi:MAG: aquaporin [Gaiellaceae bacterium]